MAKEQNKGNLELKLAMIQKDMKAKNPGTMALVNIIIERLKIYWKQLNHFV